MLSFKNVKPHESVSLFVHNVMVFNEATTGLKTVLPFFADGYPGLVYYESEEDLIVYPHNKVMPKLFLYGQTLHPLQAVFNGRYQMIVFQLYPFILKSFFAVTPKDLNDNCYDLVGEKLPEAVSTFEELKRGASDEIKVLTAFLYSIFLKKRKSLDIDVKKALQLIIQQKGRIAIREICDAVHLTERTLERRFLSETGLSPKQFARVIQFQSSLEQVTGKQFKNISDIVYENGFADQSHFIRVFKAFTGKTPSSFAKDSRVAPV